MHCPQCQKPNELCICTHIQPQSTRLHVLILQHPQEPDHEIGSALLTHLALPNSTLKIGLSWRNLNAILEKKSATPNRWAVLYLGSGVKGENIEKQPLQFVSKKGAPIPAPEQLEGIVVLDGTWSQAKALWWRNAWLLKLNRIILTPRHKSLYKELRKEPRRECLSTIESVAEVLELLGEKSAVSQHLKNLFAQLLDKQRQRRTAK
jgi:DTW domain-containing protein YfiP